MSLGNWKAFNLVDVGLINFDMMVNLWCPRKLKQATASRGMLSTRTARRAHMTELTRVGLTCRAFARAGSKGGSHDRAHTGAGSHAGHSIGPTPSRFGPASRSIWPTWFILALLFIYISCYKCYNTKRFWAIFGTENKRVKSLPPGSLPFVLALSHLGLGQASLSKPLPHRCRPHVGLTNGIDSVNQTDHSVIYIQDIQPPPTLPSYFNFKA